MNRQIEVQSCSYFTIQDGLLVKRMRVPDFIVNVGALIREISNEVFASSNFPKNKIGDPILMLYFIGTMSSD